ncbi:peptidoglycan editing factor PgeF [Lachnoanaerobaculum gingivalis]
MSIKILKKNDKNILKLKKARNGVEYFSFEALEKYEGLINGFSTRIGGVSEGPYASMNLSFSREPDNKDGVLENYKRMAEALGVKEDSFVLSYQEHSTNVRVVGKRDMGKGVSVERDYRNIDGLITDERGITLGAFFADCIPLYFYDRKKQVIGLAHSGWRGTCKKMGAVMIDEMAKNFGTDAKDVIACIGPGICQDCYQVSEDVYEEFSKNFRREDIESIFREDGKDHFRLSLWKANETVLKEAGVLPENIFTSNICTACNPDLLYSHRIMGDIRGNMAAFLALK